MIIRIPLNPGNTVVSASCIGALNFMASDMVSRDVNIISDDDQWLHQGYIRSWTTETNPRLGNRLELVINVSVPT